jgi:hypothetical protein
VSRLIAFGAGSQIKSHVTLLSQPHTLPSTILIL